MVVQAHAPGAVGVDVQDRAACELVVERAEEADAAEHVAFGDAVGLDLTGAARPPGSTSGRRPGGMQVQVERKPDLHDPARGAVPIPRPA